MANCPKLQRNFSGGSTRPSSCSATIVAPPQACGSHNQAGHGACRGADRVTQGGGQPHLFATLDRSTFSYVTPYFAINLGLKPEQLSDTFLVSTPVGESVKATRVYRGSIVLVQGRSTEADLIELELVDIDVIIGIDCFSSCYAMLDCHAKIVRLDETEEGGITAYALAQSSLIVHVKAKQDEDPYLVKLKEEFRNKVITFTLGSDGVLKLSDRLYVSDVDGLKKAIMEEAHSSRYSIHPGATKMYLDLKELYWWKGIQKQVADHVAKCLNCQQDKAEHQSPSGLA
ncbi:uncharacterized protein [Nicotiana tomentosiformis]|uniref:uncharacterized protein n=1 Tax=Nicotiana tomentosiformis TaxID=4098 RepID=UPI00388CA071